MTITDDEIKRLRALCEDVSKPYGPAWEVALWDAVAKYVVTCGGDPSKHVYGNTRRQDAVVEANRALEPLVDLARTALPALLDEVEQLQRAWLGAERSVTRLAVEAATLRGDLEQARAEVAAIKPGVDRQTAEWKAQFDAVTRERDELRGHLCAVLGDDLVPKAERDAAVRERNALRAERSIWKCATHPEAAAHGWGCPDCVFELRHEVGQLRAEVERLRAFEALQRRKDAVYDERSDELRAEVERHRKLVDALLLGNDALRHHLEVAEQTAAQIRAEVAAVTLTDDDKQRLWYENAVKLLHTAPNFTRATFEMDERRVEIVFYQPGGKTPGEVVTEREEERDEARRIARELYDGGGTVSLCTPLPDWLTRGW